MKGGEREEGREGRREKEKGGKKEMGGGGEEEGKEGARGVEGRKGGKRKIRQKAWKFIESTIPTLPSPFILYKKAYQQL